MKSPTRLLPGVLASVLTVAGAPAAKALSPNWEESGQASWYGTGFHGRPTSSGAIFNQNALTAAHSTLPLGTKIRVTMQETGQSVVVTVNDRLPWKRVRIIDLSRGAARQLGMLDSGVSMVTLSAPGAAEPIEVAEAPDEDGGSATPPRRGPRHMPRAGRAASAGRPYYRAQFAALTRH